MIACTLARLKSAETPSAIRAILFNPFIKFAHEAFIYNEIGRLYVQNFLIRSGNSHARLSRTLKWNGLANRLA